MHGCNHAQCTASQKKDTKLGLRKECIGLAIESTEHGLFHKLSIEYKIIKSGLRNKKLCSKIRRAEK
jgi:hypothetical protein